MTHHVSDALLARYAGGNLAEGWSLAVATHLALCPACRARLTAFERVGGQLLDALPATAEDMDQAWAQQLARLQAGDMAPAPARPPAMSAVAGRPTPGPLRDYIGADLDCLPWRRLGGGAAQILLPVRDGETSVRLLKIPAGKPVPEHGHGGRELTVVLEGAFRDGAAIFRRGDIEEAHDDVVHQPIATEDEDCICLAVTDAPLRFTSRLVRLIQPVLRI